MAQQPDAPRFRAYFERAEGRSVLHMLREDWVGLRGQSTGMVLIDIGRTPMARVASGATIIAAYAQELSTVTSEVGIVRLDSSDAPNVYNVDKYTVWEDLPSHPRFQEIIQAASTEDNPNLREYLKRTVLFVKGEPDADHQQPTMPNVVRMLLERRSA